MTRVPKTVKPVKQWGVFNYDTLWDVFAERRRARKYAMEQLGCDEAALALRIRDGSISIEKVIVVRHKWSGPWWTAAKLKVSITPIPHPTRKGRK